MRDFAMDVVVIGLWMLSVARITRLLTRDSITDFIRIWAYKRSGGNETMLTDFVQCAWCVGMWVSFATAWVGPVLTGWDWWLYPLLAFSGSYLTGLMAANLEPDDEPEIEIID